MKDNWEKWYRTLKAVEPEAYEKALRYGQAISLTHDLGSKIAAEIEVSHVMLACELLGVGPARQQLKFDGNDGNDMEKSL